MKSAEWIKDEEDEDGNFEWLNGTGEWNGNRGRRSADRRGIHRLRHAPGRLSVDTPCVLGLKSAFSQKKHFAVR
jgi:hypothetical protein